MSTLALLALGYLLLKNRGEGDDVIHNLPSGEGPPPPAPTPTAPAPTLPPVPTGPRVPAGREATSAAIAARAEYDTATTAGRPPGEAAARGLKVYLERGGTSRATVRRAQDVMGLNAASCTGLVGKITRDKAESFGVTLPPRERIAPGLRAAARNDR